MRRFVSARPRAADERSAHAAPAPPPDPESWFEGYLEKIGGGSNPEYRCTVGDPPCGKMFYGTTRGAVHLRCCDGSGIERCQNLTPEQAEIVKGRYERTGQRKRKAQGSPDPEPTGSGLAATIGKFFLPREWKATADRLFARLILMCLLPFTFGSNRFLRSFISEGLRVIWTPPCKDSLRGRLLDEDDAAVQRRVDAILAQSDYLQVASDGWSNLRGESFVSYVVTCAVGDFFCMQPMPQLLQRRVQSGAFRILSSSSPGFR